MQQRMRYAGAVVLGAMFFALSAPAVYAQWSDSWYGYDAGYSYDCWDCGYTEEYIEIWEEGATSWPYYETWTVDMWSPNYTYTPVSGPVSNTNVNTNINTNNSVAIANVAAASTYVPPTVQAPPSPPIESVHTVVTQEVPVPVAPPSVPYSSAPQPYVALTQIPYTGFDAGFLGNLLFWLALVAFSAGGAYAIVYYRGGAFRMLGDMLTQSVKKAEENLQKSAAPAGTNLAASSSSPQSTQRTEPASGRTDFDKGSIRTRDTMEVIPGKDDEMPRIVIHRA